MKGLKTALFFVALSVFFLTTNAFGQAPPASAEKMMQEYRKQIDKIDEDIIASLGLRAKTTAKVGQLKKETGMAVYDPKREQDLAKLHKAWAEKYGADPELVDAIFQSIINNSKKKQEALKKRP